MPVKRMAAVVHKSGILASMRFVLSTIKIPIAVAIVVRMQRTIKAPETKRMRPIFCRKVIAARGGALKRSKSQAKMEREYCNIVYTNSVYARMDTDSTVRRLIFSRPSEKMYLENKQEILRFS